MTYCMFFGFNLAPGTPLSTLDAALSDFAERLIAKGLLTSITPIGVRHRHPVLDTASMVEPDYFATMHFAGRAQADTAVTHFYGPPGATEDLHRSVIALTRDAIFLCYETAH